MGSLENIIIALIVAVVILWLLSMAIPTMIAALVALAAFLLIASGRASLRR